jgi:signal recognition particle subunit SRP68
MADQAEDVEMAEPEQPAEPGPRPQLQLQLLSTIRTAQSQNGVNHGDYGRYRCVICAMQGLRASAQRLMARPAARRRAFCTSRLANLYKALKMQHGKKTYQKRKLEVDNITEIRCAACPLHAPGAVASSAPSPCRRALTAAATAAGTCTSRCSARSAPGRWRWS